MATQRTKPNLYDQSEDFAYASDKPKGPPIAGLEVVKVVREYVPLHGGGTRTFGEMVDEYLNDCAKSGNEVQEVKLAFSPEQWFAAAQLLNQSRN